ncbi:MAG: molybdopterin cofactor-binding domain-containing protein, partial [Rubrivivax sp.]
MNHPAEQPSHRDLGTDLPPVVDDQRHIGVALPREGTRRLVQGRGQYVDDVALPRMAHVVFWRSPVAHMRITRIERSAAQALSGVIAVVVGAEIAELCKPWVATLSHLAGIKSAPQLPLALERATWQGEPVVAVVAETRARAEDAIALLEVEWDELPAVLDTETALDPQTPLIHPELGDNLCFERTLDTGGVDEAFAAADAVFEDTYVFGRHTGVTLEPRAQIADWDPGGQRLTVWHSCQAPHMMQDLYCRQFDLSESQVRVLCRDVGGSFGIKVHAYPDDFATVALSMMLGRPVKFVADR